MFKYLSITVIMLTLTVSAVSAQTTAPSPTNKTTQRDVRMEVKEDRQNARASAKAEMQQMRSTAASARGAMASARAEARANRCEAGKKNIDNTISAAQKAQSLHAQQYKTAATRIQTMVTELKSKGVSTTSLEASLVTMGTLIKKVEDEHKLYLQKLNEVKSLGCSTPGASASTVASAAPANDAAFKTALEAARTQRMNVRKAVLAVREHYVTVVRKEVINVRQQMRSNKPNTSPRASRSPSATPVVTATPAAQQ